MSRECSYCCKSGRISRDHIFPQFLGGRSRITTCKRCNDRFGHSFEAAVSMNLAPLQIFLRVCGLRFPTRANWKRAYKDRVTSLEFDLDEHLEATPSAPVILRDGTGRIRGAVFPNEKSAKQFAKSLRNKGLAKAVRIRKTLQKGLRPQLNSFNLQIDTNLRKLAMKMCVGLSDRLNRNGQMLDTNARQFLIRRSVPHVPARIAYLTYPLLEENCPPLSHVIYVEGNHQKRRSYGVVRFFNTLQLYCLLSNHYSGGNFAALGVLDLSTKKESFSEITPLELHEAPPTVTLKERDVAIRRWAGRLTSQIALVLGPNRGSVRMDPVS